VIRQRLEAWALHRFSHRYNRKTSSIKRELLAPVAGRVLEIASGTGANLAYYGKEVEWTGLDPNPHGHRYALQTAQRLGLQARTYTGRAEGLPFEPGAFDCVVATLTLCSVQDPAAALREVRRVLRPGGRFFFLEHVAAPPDSSHRLVQERARPWFRCLLGCNPALETASLIRGAGFHLGAIREHMIDMPVVRPHITGVVRCEEG
jgi:ubiquinone/menaquinone biosynthesis C-methylase UbiE